MVEIMSIVSGLTSTVQQAMGLLSLILGIILGEFLTFKIFGKPKPAAIIIDIILFVLIISLVFSFISFAESGITYYVASFLIGVISIIIVRGIESPFGLTERDIEQDKVVIRIIRTLSRYGLDEEDMKEALFRSGFSPKTVDRYRGLINRNTPKYLTRLVKIEKALEDMKTSIRRIEARAKISKTRKKQPKQKILRKRPATKKSLRRKPKRKSKKKRTSYRKKSKRKIARKRPTVRKTRKKKRPRYQKRSKKKTIRQRRKPKKTVKRKTRKTKPKRRIKYRSKTKPKRRIK